jgi:hypothetical protein
LDEASGLFKKAETIVVNHSVSSAAMKLPGVWAERKMMNEEQSTLGPPAKERPLEGFNSTPKISNTAAKRLSRVPPREKPQSRFKTPVDNSLGPFVPKLKEKPNSIKPLSILPEYNLKNEEL